MGESYRVDFYVKLTGDDLAGTERFPYVLEEAGFVTHLSVNAQPSPTRSGL